MLLLLIHHKSDGLTGRRRLRRSHGSPWRNRLIRIDDIDGVDDIDGIDDIDGVDDIDDIDGIDDVDGVDDDILALLIRYSSLLDSK